MSRLPRLGWWLAFVAAIFIAAKAPAFALKAADEGTLLSAVCSPTGLKLIDASGSGQESGGTQAQHGDCWCVTHLAVLDGGVVTHAILAATTAAVALAAPPAARVAPPFLRPASTAPPSVRV